jgi:hypothetical protein
MRDGKNGNQGVLGNLFSISYTKTEPCGCFKSHQPPQRINSLRMRGILAVPLREDHGKAKKQPKNRPVAKQ